MENTTKNQHITNAANATIRGDIPVFSDSAYNAPFLLIEGKDGVTYIDVTYPWVIVGGNDGEPPALMTPGAKVGALAPDVETADLSRVLSRLRYAFEMDRRRGRPVQVDIKTHPSEQPPLFGDGDEGHLAQNGQDGGKNEPLGQPHPARNFRLGYRPDEWRADKERHEGLSLADYVQQEIDAATEKFRQVLMSPNPLLSVLHDEGATRFPSEVKRVVTNKITVPKPEEFTNQKEEVELGSLKQEVDSIIHYICGKCVEEGKGRGTRTGFPHPNKMKVSSGEIVLLAVQGCSPYEIAARLDLSAASAGKIIGGHLGIINILKDRKPEVINAVIAKLYTR